MYASDREYPSIHRLDVTYKQKLIHSNKKWIKLCLIRLDVKPESCGLAMGRK